MNFEISFEKTRPWMNQLDKICCILHGKKREEIYLILIFWRLLWASSIRKPSNEPAGVFNYTVLCYRKQGQLRTEWGNFGHFSTLNFSSHVHHFGIKICVYLFQSRDINYTNSYPKRTNKPWEIVDEKNCLK